jgi:anti-anti-sigma factor
MALPFELDVTGPPAFAFVLDPPWNGSHAVRVIGELDRAGVDELGRFLAHLHGSVRVDCAQLAFIDVSGIRVLLAAAARLSSLQLVNVPPSIRRMLDMTDTLSLLAEDSAYRA